MIPIAHYRFMTNCEAKIERILYLKRSSTNATANRRIKSEAFKSVEYQDFLKVT